MGQAAAELRAHGYVDGARRVALRTLDWIARQPPEARDDWAVIIPIFLYEAGNLAEARARLERLAARGRLEPDGAALLGVIAAAQGDRATADSIGAALVASAPDPAARVGALVNQASIAATLADRDRALENLRDAFRGGFAWRTALHIQPGFDSLRDFPTFEALVRPGT
jgi:hypothetical protein